MSKKTVFETSTSLHSPEATYELNTRVSEQRRGDAAAKQQIPRSWDLPFVGVFTLKRESDKTMIRHA